MQVQHHGHNKGGADQYISVASVNDACSDQSPCTNGATCEDTGQDTYQCHCPSGYTGTNCEIVDSNSISTNTAIASVTDETVLHVATPTPNAPTNLLADLAPIIGGALAAGGIIILALILSVIVCAGCFYYRKQHNIKMAEEIGKEVTVI